jgi:hypothetical protein
LSFVVVENGVSRDEGVGVDGVERLPRAKRKGRDAVGHRRV